MNDNLQFDKFLVALNECLPKNSRGYAVVSTMHVGMPQLGSTDLRPNIRLALALTELRVKYRWKFVCMSAPENMVFENLSTNIP